MNRTDIKGSISKIVPDKGMEERLSEKILQKNNNKLFLKPIIPIFACLVIVISFGVIGLNLIRNKNNQGIYIPKIKLNKEPNDTTDMIGLIVYQGKIYTQTGTNIASENAKSLLDKKLGTTKGNIDEWSNQDDYAVEFASTIGEKDVYSVKGYDKSFRIMTYGTINGTTFAEFYECLNGITIKSGDDLFSKLKIENNVKTAKYEYFKSWDKNMKQYKEIINLKVLNSFVVELKNTSPYKQESLSYLWDDKQETNQRFVYLTLNDNTIVQLRLFKDGYIYYSGSHIFFKMGNQAFKNLYNELK